MRVLVKVKPWSIWGSSMEGLMKQSGLDFYPPVLHVTSASVESMLISVTTSFYARWKIGKLEAHLSFSLFDGLKSALLQCKTNDANDVSFKPVVQLYTEVLF